jgi:hypothetical protein
MFSVLRKLVATGATAALAAVVLVPANSAVADDDISVPRTTWPVCDDFRVDYCIESVSIRPLGTRSDLKLEWYDSGTGPEKFVEEVPPSSIVGPAVIAPGQSATYTASLPELYAGLNASFSLQGVGLLDSTPADGAALTATVTTGAEDAGSAQLSLFVDINGDGTYSRDELVDVWGISVGSASQVGTGVTETMAGTALPGRWSHPRWENYGLNAFGYDGVTIDLKTANVFTNHLFFTVIPVKASPTNATNRAIRADGSGRAANMNLDDRITVKVRTGQIRTGVSIGIANNLILRATPANAEAEVSSTLEISGTPVPVPQVANFSQCTGETGVATAVVTTMQGFVLVENGNGGMGVDGLSGRMAVSSNGVACGVSTPTWDENTETLNWVASAPHFEPDGVTPNKGFYKAVIPANDALLLWGLTDPKRAVTALNVQVTEETGGPAVFVSKISYLFGEIIIDVTGFEFSKPKIQIGKKGNVASAFAKKRDLQCVDPLTKKRVTVKDAYGCPKAAPKPVQSFLMQSASQTSLNATERRAVQTYLNRFAEANKFICTGIFREGASQAQRLAARKRAVATCNHAKRLEPNLSTFAQTRPTKAASYVNKVLVTMKDEKN